MIANNKVTQKTPKFCIVVFIFLLLFSIWLIWAILSAAATYPPDDRFRKIAYYFLTPILVISIVFQIKNLFQIFFQSGQRV